MEAIEKAEQLKNELDSLQPLDSEAEARIMQKFRLDWNYHSNHLEGNSLTFGETKVLILFDKAVGDKNFKDYDEMRDHNFVIKLIEESSKDNTELTEKFIREIHLLLLKQPHFREAQTSEGKLTRRKIEVGKYKTQPNHVVTVTDEPFYFATPEETPAKMRELVEWFRKEKKKSNVNPIILAARFHYEFIKIHPFDDGNGRVARILMNFILMQFGYPPVIIKTEDKQNYILALQQADAGIYEPFFEYIAQNSVRSLEIMIKGAKGESIDEPDDLDKKLVLLDQKLKTVGAKVEVVKSQQVIKNILTDSIAPLLKEFFATCKKFSKFYLNTEIYFSKDHHTRVAPENMVFEYIKEEGANSQVEVRFNYDTFNYYNFNEFGFSSNIKIDFKNTTYVIFRNINSPILEKPYTDNLSKDEITKIVNIIAEEHIAYIENHFNNR